MKIDLTGKIAIVTGATGDLGRVMVTTLAGCGADVVIHYLNNREKAEELAAAVAALGRKAFAAQADVTDCKSVMKMKEEVAAGFGSPDIVVNNAVITYRWTTILEQAPEDYEGQFRSCVLHNVYMAKAFVPDMIKKGKGRIIGINTECAMQNYPTQSAYVAGKRGMDGILRVLAKEIGEHQITVNQIAPGWMVSNRDRLANTESSPEYEQRVPMKHRGTDQDVANLVAFLASDLAGFITGAFIPVCGGDVMPAI
jgi:3-oxoacyl-[acyl-carrier protein] reductase